MHSLFFSIFFFFFFFLLFRFVLGFNLVGLVVAIGLTKGAIEGIQIDYIDISPLPMLNTDLEKQGTYPAEVEAFRQRILEADSILFASPEYNYSVTGNFSKFHMDSFI